MTDEQRAPDAPMSRAEHDLAIVAENSRGDRYLQTAITSAERGLPAAIGLLVNGMVVYGSLAHSRLIAEAIDAHRDGMLRTLEQRGGESAADWARARDALAGLHARDADASERERREHADRMDAKYEEPADFDPLTAPAELARDAMRHAARSALTLRDVSILTGGDRLELPLLRAQVRQIAAWWLVDLDDPDVQVVVHDATPPAE